MERQTCASSGFGGVQPGMARALFGTFRFMRANSGRRSGVTYFASVDTSTGHIEIKGDFDESSSSSKLSEDELDRQLMAKKFFELNN